MRPGPFWAVLTAALAAVLLGAWLLYDALFPVFIGFALAYAFDPLADRLEDAGLRRDYSVLLIMAGVFGLAALVLGLIIPQLAAEARDFARSFPDHLSAALDKVLAKGGSWGISIPHDRPELLRRARGLVNSASLSLLAPAGRAAAKFFSGAGGMLVGALNLVVIPVVFYYFLRDLSKIRLSLIEIFPPRHQDRLTRHLDEADRVFSGYIRGQILVALILAVLYALGLACLGIRFGVLIGILSGLLNVIPYLGVISGVVLSLVMAAVDYTGLGAFIGIAVVFAVAQALEGFVITPRVVGDRVGLSTLETLIALILGGEFGGLIGMMLAIPVAGCLKVFTRDALGAYRRSRLYRG